MTTATANFGAYALQPIGSDLLVMLGNSPGNEDGCQVFSSSNGVSLTHEYAPSEQGSNVDSQLVGSDAWVCGSDPTDDWTLGNLYHRDAVGAWSKIRTLPLTIHALGLWHDGSNIWVAAGCHTGDNVTWKGRILKSTDSGATWNAVDVNDYRMYDVIGFDNKLYAIGYDYTGTYSQDLHVSADAGATWAKVNGVTPAIKPRLVLHDGALIGIQSSMTGLFSITAGGSVGLYLVPFTLANQWNVLESDGTYLYAMANDGRIFRTNNLATWEIYTRVLNAISIKWWSGHGLMIGDMGTAARIWQAQSN